MRNRSLFIVSSLIAACAPHRAPVVFDLKTVEGEVVVEPDEKNTDPSYERVSARSAAILGCNASPNLPMCSVALPTAEEDSAFHAEAVRLADHGDARCRNLGAAIIANQSLVRMYPRALVRHSRGETLYGVGHAYEIDETWLVRIARRLDDLNERTLDEKKRTLRHEMSHTIGATESSISGWSAEDYATRCS